MSEMKGVKEHNGNSERTEHKAWKMRKNVGNTEQLV
jgi:hypothetical protein